MERIQSFEIHDLTRCPTFIRESVTESLGNALRWGKVYAGGATELFYDFCTSTNSETILDLCSGSGEPISILLDALSERGLPKPTVTLSDLYPNLTRMQDVVDKHAEHISIHRDPIDATDVPQDIEHNARTIISAFHHFPPALAQSILRDCVTQNKAIFILEPMPRQAYRTLSVASSLIAATALNPILTKQNRFKKALCTYTTPIIPLVNSWDSMISLLRVYTEDDLMGLVEPFGQDYHWEFHEIPVRLGGKATAFMGYPK